MFKNLKVRTRLLLILLVSSLSLLVVGLIGLINGHRTAMQIDEVYFGGVDKLEEISTLQDTLEHKLIISVQKLRDETLTWEEGLDTVRQVRNTLNTTWSHYTTTDPGLEPGNLIIQHGIVEKTQPLINRLQDSLNKLEGTLQRQDKQQLNAFGATLLFPLVEPLLKNINDLVALHISDTTTAYNNALTNSYWFQFTTLLVLLVALAILIPLTLAIIKSVVKPIEYASECIATGDTKMDVKVISGGELGRLLEAIRSMFLSLDKISSVLTAISTGDLTVESSLRSDRDVLGNALHGMVTQMRSMIGDIKNEVQSITSSSQEIMASLTHISSGASETASAVTETTTTVEELKQTANVSVDKAKDVLANAEETLRAVTSSEESVMATIQDMNQIRDRMQIISDSILKLSEKGAAIAEIMDTVTDIAEQSNLLAVNAAIEAAKAGEVGRSFGVVAQEIRTLAEQSKGATVQVRSLLADIQQATTAAVLATEQGSKAVHKGVEQSTQTNKTIKELALKMTRVTQATNQIVLSNQQQLIGTEQITIAMGQISEATSQHVEHLKQIEGAVANMNLVGETLKSLTDNYRISEDANMPKKLTKGIRLRQRDPEEHLVGSSF